jgi:hypothetical protein
VVQFGGEVGWYHGQDTARPQGEPAVLFYAQTVAPSWCRVPPAAGGDHANQRC